MAAVTICSDLGAQENKVRHLMVGGGEPRQGSREGPGPILLQQVGRVWWAKETRQGRRCQPQGRGAARGPLGSGQSPVD